ncbi:MAG: rhodanese-like domain-containing protein [Mycobacteriales bacterium]
MSDHSTLQRDGLTVTIVETPSLGDRSYVVDDGTSALVIDPQRDIDRIEKVLEQRSVQLAAVAETHAHNDYVTGGLEFARKADVPYLVPCEAEADYERTQVCDEDVRQVGQMTVRTMGTPGHTPHHVSFAVGRGDRPTMVFTGGSMLFGSVGRTDLVSPELTVDLSHRQYASVRRLADELPGDAAVLPTHGFGSFCSATPTSGDASTVEQQRTQNPALTQDEDDFVRSLLDGFDAYPAYYVHMGPTNLAGPAPVDLSPVHHADADELRRRVDAGEWVVDLRDRTAFARGHVPGSYSFDANGNMVTFLGWLIPWGTPLTLIADSPEQVAEAQRELVRIGIDRPAAQATAPVEQLAGERGVASFRTATFEDVAAVRERDPDVLILDVRRNAEWQDGHVEGAVHIPLHELLDRTDEVPADQPVHVHCAGGFRATIAASILDAAGKDVTAVIGAFNEAEGAGLPVVTTPA